MADRAAVPTKDYGRQNALLWSELQAAVADAMQHDKPVLGRAVGEFEDELAGFFGKRHAIGVGSGTDALLLALRAHGIGEGSDVLTCSHTFAGVLSAILLAGARPVLVPPEPVFGQLDAGLLEDRVTERTRAIVAVHFYGHPVDTDAVAAFARQRGLVLIEDCAQAHGATWRGRPVGSHGDIATLSFHPSKNLGAFGDGGAVLTDSAAVADQLRVWRNLGKTGKYDFGALAANTKLDTLQAAILRVKLRHLQRFVTRRSELAKRYLRGLDGVGDLRLPAVHPLATHAWHLFVVRTPRRDELKAFLAARGVRSGLHYPVAAHAQPGIGPLLDGARCPQAEAWAASVLTLPLSHEHRDDEIDRVIEAVRAFYSERP